MTAEKDKKNLNRITRSDIDKADEVQKGKEANLLNVEVQLGIIPEQSEAISDVLSKDKKAQRPN